MWKYNNMDELYHHGVLGMKWGHRKSKRAKEIERYKKLDKYKKRADAYYDYNDTRTNRQKKKAAVSIQKDGVYKARVKNKAKRIATGAVAAGLALDAIGSYKVTLDAAKSGNWKKASLSGANTALTGVAAGIWAGWNRQQRAEGHQIRSYEYEQYKKKYGKLKNTK